MTPEEGVIMGTKMEIASAPFHLVTPEESVVLGTKMEIASVPFHLVIPEESVLLGTKMKIASVTFHHGQVCSLLEKRGLGTAIPLSKMLAQLQGPSCTTGFLTRQTYRAVVQ
mmetsp:Transcript_36202/g.48991  ORF Transcript_36202/g.48991 Transcript_36202/m.48991 type:complete len:112 (-) Transcript_36202:65-400(-)